MSLNSKNSALNRIFRHKCPRCGEGDLFPTTIFSFKKIFTMNEHCSECGLKYEIETGFFWGSMYIAYAISGGFFLVGYLIVAFTLDLGIWNNFLVITPFIMLMYAWIFRMARSIWIHIFVSYKGDRAIHQFNN